MIKKLNLTKNYSPKSYFSQLIALILPEYGF